MLIGMGISVIISLPWVLTMPRAVRKKPANLLLGVNQISQGLTCEDPVNGFQACTDDIVKMKVL
jgi:hypothetical protein